jgi:hypothetical protein
VESRRRHEEPAAEHFSSGGRCLAMTGPTEAIAAFRDVSLPLKGAYPTIEIRSFAIVDQAATYNLFTRVELSPSPFRRLAPRVLRAHPRFHIVSEQMGSDSLGKLLGDLVLNRIRVAGRTVELATPSKNPPATGPPTPFWHFYRDRADPLYWDGQSPTGEPARRYRLETYGGEGDTLATPDVVATLDAGLLRLRPRWLGLPDLMKRFLGIEPGFRIANNTHISVDLPIRCDLYQPSFGAPGRLSVPVTAPGALPAGRLRVNALLRNTKGGSWTRETKVTGPTRIGRDGIGLFHAEVRTTRGRSVILHLLLNNQIVDKQAYDLWDPKSPNPRMMALRALDRAMLQLDEVLSDPEAKGKDAETFEVAVSNLMSVSGFVTLNPGRKHARAGETVDVLAFHPLAPVVFCIECTWKVATHQGKLGKLHQRATDLAKALPHHSVRALLISSKSEFTKPEAEEAGAMGISLLSRGDLQNLRTRAEWDLGPSEIAQWLSGGKFLRLSPS